MLRQAQFALVAAVFLVAGCPAEKPDCKGSATVCDGVCSNLLTDNANCGACGNACPAGNVCSAGSCGLTCQAGLVNCDGTCIAPDTDRDHCGVDNACAGGEVCVDGELCSSGSCQQTCVAAQVACPVVAPTYCADLSRDANNCGSCGTVCPLGQLCSGSTCSCPATTPDACTTGGGAAFCTNKQTDPLNCGACGTICAAGTACSIGNCVASCPAGLLACGGKCVDPMSDPNYCGATTCADGETCLSTSACHHGACVPACTWTVAESYSLASAPPGSQLAVGAGTGTYTTANGRTGLLMSSSGAYLRVPTSVTSQTFAVDLDYYTGEGTATMIGEWVFSDPGPGALQRIRGQGFSLTDMAPLGRVLATSVYKASDACNGWATSECAWTTPNGYARQTTPIGSFADAWHTLRIEGDRSTCRFRTYQDGVLLDSYAGVCDTSGANVFFGVNGTAMFTNYKVSTGTPGCIGPIPRSCADVLGATPGTPSGQYTLDPDGPGGAAPYTAYCDMTTAGGGWTLALAYDHPAGGTAALVPGAAPSDPQHGYSHMSAGQLAMLPFTAARFYCQSSLHPRKIHAVFGSAGAIAYLKGSGANDLAYWQTFVAMPDHSANLPAAADLATQQAPAEEHLTFEPFYTDLTYHWNVMPYESRGYRMECDDFAGGPANATLHQVWVR